MSLCELFDKVDANKNFRDDKSLSQLSEPEKSNDKTN